MCTAPETITADIKKYLSENLSIRIKKSDEYNGGMGGGSMYTESVKIQLLLGDDVISEEYL